MTGIAVAAADVNEELYYIISYTDYATSIATYYLLLILVLTPTTTTMIYFY